MSQAADVSSWKVKWTRREKQRWAREKTELREGGPSDRRRGRAHFLPPAKRQSPSVAMATPLSFPFSELALILAAFQSAGHVCVCAFVCWLLNESSKWRGKPLENVLHTHNHVHRHTNTHQHTLRPKASKVLYTFKLTNLHLFFFAFNLFLLVSVYSAVAPISSFLSLWQIFTHHTPTQVHVHPFYYYFL